MATRTIVFDMDGTLVQTRAASWDVFQDTARKFELPIRSAEEFFELFRGNFFEGLKALCPDPSLEHAVREHFLQALRDRYAPRFVPGMRDVVKALAARYPLAVMSSNAMTAIRRILEEEGLAACFAHVFSGEVGASKEAHLRQILDEPSYGNARHCSLSYAEEGSYAEGRAAADDVVLITDTVGDVREGRSCGVRVIGVAWGMHGCDALRQAGAETVVMWPQELLTLLIPANEPALADGSACQCAVSGTCRGQAASAPASAPAPARAPAAGWPWPAVASASLRRRERQLSNGRRPAPPDPGRGDVDPILAAALRRISAGSSTPPGTTQRTKERNR
ncbi:MAG TPA: HAD family hydrolase [Streptosporangiaceae bacterium]